MPPSEDDLLATETTGLLMPSASSTELSTVSNYKGKTLPMASSYEDVRESVEMQLQALTQSKKILHEPPNTSRDLNRRPAFTMLLIGCILSVAFVAYPHFHHGSSEKISGTPGPPIPFSRQDPVDDLQLLEFHRPDETAPPSKLFLNHAFSSSSQRRRTTLPTNAWYQNMLLLRGEPSNIHRVYASPYMLDVVGIIPGLRAHPNHIDSSKFVMQLAYDDQSGLTLGATGDASDDSNRTSNKDSHRYSILTTTKLGVTVGWVRYVFIRFMCIHFVVYVITFHSYILHFSDFTGCSWHVLFACSGYAVHNHGVQ
jgi:hypothetical protein